jgi:nucleotide-binding universal stress UspA family protein
MPIQHRLVPLDFSPDAEQALAYAMALAQTHQARLTLLHVKDTLSWGVAQAEARLPPSVWHQLETRLAEDMAERFTRVQEAGLHGETVIAEGVPFQTIIDTARDTGVDLIVMGTRGRTELTPVLIGSVAERVVRLAPCPVLVTRKSADTSAT